MAHTASSWFLGAFLERQREGQYDLDQLPRSRRAFMDREPRLADRIHEVVRRRLAGDIVTPQGDVVSEELESPEGIERPANDKGRP
jgi:hypothetical protein